MPRNWGRDQGLSVLPIHGSFKSSTALDLERILCVELYSHDPFDVTGPVSDDQNFYGRRDEAIDLARKLQKGQIRSCLGIRKVGKTSIINRILGEIRKSNECISIMVDCSRDDIWEQSAPQLLNSIAMSIAAANESNEGYASATAAPDSIDLKQARGALEATIFEVRRPLSSRIR